MAMPTKTIAPRRVRNQNFIGWLPQSPASPRRQDERTLRCECVQANTSSFPKASFRMAQGWLGFNPLLQLAPLFGRVKDRQKVLPATLLGFVIANIETSNPFDRIRKASHHFRFRYIGEDDTKLLCRLVLIDCCASPT